MSQEYDGGEAVLAALRNLGVDYIISSPGSAWPPVWEALARQRTNEAAGPGYIHCWHESLAVAMAMEGAYQGEVPMLVCSGASNTYGEDPDFDPGWQWLRQHGIVGGANRLVDPVVKWSGQVSSPFTLYESVRRAGELAQRVPNGPTFLNIPLELMLRACEQIGRDGLIET